MFPYNSNSATQAPAWNPSMMYYQPNLNPYDSQQFLNRVFDFNVQSITAFQTLPHELKLKFYLSVQQMKLLGYMNDRTGYQNILQQIARRKMIIKKPQVKQQVLDQGQDWGVKLENLCEGHLKKIQKNNFLEDFPVNYTHNSNLNENTFDLITGDNKISSNTGQKQDQFDWVQPKQAQQISIPNTNNHMNQNQNSMHNNCFSKINGKQKHNTQNNYLIKEDIKQQANADDNQQFDDFVQVSSQPVQVSTQPIQKYLSFPLPQTQNIASIQAPMPVYISDSSIRAHEKHIDIWDLQVIQDDPDKYKKIILNKPQKQSSSKQIQSQKQLQQSQIINNNQQSQKSIENNRSLQFKSNFSIHQSNAENNHNLSPFVSSTLIGSQKLATKSHQFSELQNLDFLSYQQFPSINYTQNKQNNKKIQNNYEQQNKVIHENKVAEGDDDQFQWQQNEKNSNQETVNTTPDINNQINIQLSKQQQPKIAINALGFDFLAVPEQQKHNSTSSDGDNKTQLNGDYSFLQVPNNKQIKLETSFGMDLSGLEESLQMYSNNQQPNNEQENNYINFKKRSDYQEEDLDSQINSQMFASSLMSGVDTQILQFLKRFPKTTLVVSALKKKIFDYDRQFYKEALQMISKLGFQHNPDYQFIKQQQKVCDQIFKLTQAYTAAVDQQKQDEIKNNLNKCKILYTKLDPNKTASTVKKYVKMQGKGLSYQIGRLSLEAGVPSDLLKKVINDSNFNQIATLYYLMVFFGSIFSTSTLACQVIDYMEYIYQDMQKLGNQIAQMPLQCKKIIKQNQKFLLYRQNLAQISTLIRRFVLLGSLCSKGELYYNMQIVQQKIDSLPQLKTKPSQQQLLPNYFLTFFSQFACSRSNNVYTLHSQMGEFINQHPLCALCIQSLQIDQQDHSGGTKRDDGKFYHFKCWNFKHEVMKFKSKQMSSSTVLQIDDQK